MKIEAFITKVKNKLINLRKKYCKKIYNLIFKSKYKNELERILNTHNKLPIIVFQPLVDWNIPLFQRPQHIALNLAQKGYLYFYCVTNEYDDVHGFEQPMESIPNLFITDQYELLMGRIDNKIVHIYAQDPNIDSTKIQCFIKSGCTILYEYIDELTEELCVSKKQVLGRHEMVLRNENCMVIATADKLINEVKNYRNSNYALVSNGVEYEHFNKKNRNIIPNDIKHILVERKPIIGYFGAFAKWFDYELIKELAYKRPNYQILLLGWDFDGSLKNSNIRCIPNVIILGPIKYKELPNYSQYFDVSIIPFIINDITESTSPVKLFEYMAIGQPIVTTDMPECRKFKSVLVADTHSDFLNKIDYALTLATNDEYLNILKNEAIENTWESKSEIIKRVLEKS